MEIKAIEANSSVLGKKKAQAVYVPEGGKLTDFLPQFRKQKNPDVHLGMLKLAFGDLVANLRNDRFTEYALHKSAFGQYGRYTVDLFFALQSYSFDAHIDILDGVNIISVIVLDIGQRTLKSVHPLIADGAKLLGLQKDVAGELDEILSWLGEHENKKETQDAPAS